MLVLLAGWLSLGNFRVRLVTRIAKAELEG